MLEKNLYKPQIFYSEDGAPGTPPAAEPTTPDSELMIPKSRFDDINRRAKEAEAKLQQLEAERQAELEKRLEEQQKWKELADKRAAQLAEAERKAAKADEYEIEMKSYVEESIGKIPDDMKSMVPDGSIEQQFKWLKRNYEKLMKPTAPPTGAGARGAGGSTTQIELSPEEQQIARKFGMTDEEYFKYKEK